MNGPRRFATRDGRLKEEQIVAGLEDAIEGFKNGEVYELREVCLDVAEAIRWFEEACEKNGGPI